MAFFIKLTAYCKGKANTIRKHMNDKSDTNIFSLTGKKVNKIISVLDNAKQIVIITHQNPDGDAIGSLLGLYNFLKDRYNVIPVTPNSYPDFLKWMPGNNEVIIFNQQKEKAAEVFKKADVIFGLDFNDINRIESAREAFSASNAFKILIDHHPMPGDFTDLIISETHRSAAAELLYDVLKSINKELISIDVAECLFAGIMTDTGCFSFNSSNPETYRIVARLLEKGINKDKIFNQIYENYSEDRMRLTGFCLNERMKVFAQEKSAYVYLSQNDVSQYKFTKGDTEGFVNLPFSIKGINLSGFFFEFPDYIKISLRSKGSFDVNNLAREHFNGGGHKNAAGGRFYGTLNDAINHFETLLPNIKAELDYEL